MYSRKSFSLTKRLIRIGTILTLILASLACSSIDNLISIVFPEDLVTFFIDRRSVPMALVPAGPFEMGSLVGEVDERPVHTVRLNAFYIDQYEVTNSQYDICLKEGACEPTTDTTAFESSYSRGVYYGNPEYANYPLIYVNWFEAREYCAWRGGRLPTEAEWEKAARGGLESEEYPWGDVAPVCKAGAENGARFDDDMECNNSDTQQVGSYSENGYHLYDMAGNVWEWVIDYYDENYYANSLTDEPSGPETGNYPVVRGGSWNSALEHLRVSDRRFNDSKSGSFNIGFRCVRENTLPIPSTPEGIKEIFSPPVFSAVSQ